jgi:hypothetical protein
MERLLYRLENVLVMVIAFYLFLLYGTTWTGFILFLTLPKWIILLPKKPKALVYVYHTSFLLIHSYSLVVIVGLFAFLFIDIVPWSILGWVIHIAAYRVVIYKEKTI